MHPADPLLPGSDKQTRYYVHLFSWLLLRSQFTCELSQMIDGRPAFALGHRNG
jgi:hypothetical protein